MTTEDFIGYLEERRLISGGIARQLRAKAAQGDHRINPRSILKYLVKKELVSRETAQGILETRLFVSDKAESSILGLAPPAADAGLVEPTRSKSGGHDGPANQRQLRSNGGTTGDDLFSGAARGANVFDPLEEVVETFPLGGTEELAGPSAARTNPKKKGRRGAKEKETSEWDSPLLLVGGAGVALLLIAGTVLYFLYIRENSDLVLKDANSQFESGAYTQAIAGYERFVANWPSHEDISQARVRLGIARIRRDTEGGSDFAGALQTARAVIDEIEDEPAFISDGADDAGISEGKKDFSELLTKIAEGLAQQADAAVDADMANQRIEQIQHALALTANTKYVPDRLRQVARLNEVRQTLERVQQRRQRDADLAATLVTMDEAISAGRPAAAFAARLAILKQYPTLIDDASLADKVGQIAEAEQALINFVAQQKPAATDALASPVIAEIALAERRHVGSAPAAANGSGPTVVKVDGAVYALNASDGAMLWRRYVGLDGGDSHPTVLANGNVVVADSQRGELLCVAGSNGKLVWRQPLEGKLAAPVAAAGKLLVASDAGRLFVLNEADGALIGYVQFTQPLRVAPALNESGDRAYVIGEHSNLYTLSTRDYACLGVYYVGHSAGSVVVPPVVVLNKLAVADNSGAETCRLRLFALNDQGAAAAELVAHRLAGLVTTPLQKSGRRLASVTTRGQADVFDVGGGNDDAALTAIASREPQDREQLARFSLMHEGALWVAGRQLLKLAILPTDNQLPVQSIDRNYQGDAFDYPLQAVDNVVVHLRRPAGRGGTIVAAMDGASGGALWETEIAAPPAGPPVVDASALRIAAGSSSGAIYNVDREAMTRRIQDAAVRADRAAPAALMTDSVDLGQGRMVLAGVGASQVLLYRPADPRQPVTAITLPGPLSCPPVAWGDGFVAATEVGQVFAYDATSGAPRGAPFQPEIIPGQKYAWLKPAVAGEGAGAQLVLSDGRARIHLVGHQAQPQPHLAAAATGDLGRSPLVSPIAVVGSRAYAGTEAGDLAHFTLPELAAGEPIALGGRVTWGPYAAPAGVVLATDAGELLMVGQEGALRWRQTLAHGAPAGTPLVDGESALVLYGAGVLARVSLADGTEAAAVDLGQPAIEGPVAFGPRVILASPDGTLLVVNRP